MLRKKVQEGQLRQAPMFCSFFFFWPSPQQSEFLRPGSNPQHSSNQSHSRGTTKSLKPTELPENSQAPVLSGPNLPLITRSRKNYVQILKLQQKKGWGKKCNCNVYMQWENKKKLLKKLKKKNSTFKRDLFPNTIFLPISLVNSRCSILIYTLESEK